MGYFTPLKIFVVGSLFLLLTFPFFPAIGTAAAGLAADPASVQAESWVWGWTWITAQGVIKWLVYAVLEGGIWVATFKAFWSMKNR